MLNAGDRVSLTRSTLMDPAGSIGTVIRKFAPMHSTSCWYVVIKFDHRWWETSFNYPDPILRKLQA